MGKRSENSISRIWLVIRWAVILPMVLLLVLTLGLAARYLPAKARLDRMKLDRGGKIFLKFEPVVPDWIRKLVGQERCEPFDRLQEIEFRHVTDENLLKWRGCFDVESVVFDAYSSEELITDRSLLLFGELRSLRSLVIGRGRFTRQGLRALANCTQLTNLEIHHAELSPGWCDGIQDIQSLKQFAVGDFGESTAQSRDIRALAAIRHLRMVRLGLHDSTYAQHPLSPLEESPIGCTWRIKVENLAAELLEPLAALPDLDTLVVVCDTMSPDALLPLKKSPSLRRLQVYSYDFPPEPQSDPNLGMLKGCQHVELLEICLRNDVRPVTDNDQPANHGLEHLADLPLLTNLVLHGRLSAKDWEGVARLTNLRGLRLHVWNLDARASRQHAHLRSLIHLEELALPFQGIADNDLNVILSMPKLHWLEFDALVTIAPQLQVLAERPDFPAALKPHLPAALREFEKVAQSGESPDHPTTVTIGWRKRLPSEWMPNPGID